MSKAEARKRLEDIDFIASLQDMTLERLHQTFDNYQNKKAPEWKKVAILRALKRRLEVLLPEGTANG